MKDCEYVIPPTVKWGETTFKRRLTDGRVVDATEDFRYEFKELMLCAISMYEDMVSAGIPPEDARYILPNACCTNLIVTMNARELLHFFSLRCCERAQWEIRDLANQMLDKVKEVAPTIFKKAGPSCVRTGKCPEGKKSCGKVA